MVLRDHARDEESAATRLLDDADAEDNDILLLRASDDMTVVDDDTHPTTTTTTSRPRLRLRAARWQVRSPRMIIVLVAFSKFCIVCSGMMLLVPLFRLLEDAICHGVLADTTPGLLDEMKCKDDTVQARLATFLGWSGLVSSIVSTLLPDSPLPMRV